MSEHSRRGIEALTEIECTRLLKSQDLGRLAFIVDGRPEIFPVNYAFDEGVVVFRTAPGLKFDRAPQTYAAFEADNMDHERGVAWSVVVKGTVHDITTTIDRLSEHLRRLVVRTAAPGERSEWMAVYSTSVSGRRFALLAVDEQRPLPDRPA